MARILGGRVAPTGGYQFGLRKIWITEEGSRDPVFGKLRVPLVPTLHGESFTVPAGADELAFGYMLCGDGTFKRQSLAFRFGNSYAFQFEPQLTHDELRVWNRELAEDYEKMGPPLRSLYRGRDQPSRVCRIFSDIRSPDSGDTDRLL